MTRWKPKAGDLIDALRAAYGLDTSDLHVEEWALLTEVPLRVPHPQYVGTWHEQSRWGQNERTIDVLMVRCWSGKPHGHERLAIEVKISRADYRNETADKRAPAEAAAHRCAYLTPAGLITPDELPDGWGLIEVHESPEAARAADKRGRLLGQASERVYWRTPAARRKPSCDLDYLVAAHARRASRAEERIRRGESAAAEVAALREQVRLLTAARERDDRRVDRARARAQRAVDALALIEGGNDCSACDQPLRYDRHSGGWKHRDKAQERVCEEARAEADRQRRQREYGAAYMWGRAAPVIPKALAEAYGQDDEEEQRSA